MPRPPSPTTAGEAREAWFLAGSSDEQAEALEALGRLGGRGDLPEAREAVATLVELSHAAVHPRERVPVLRALGRCTDQAFAVPSLVSLLDDPDPDVVEASLDAVGRIGSPFGGAWVARWLDRSRREPPPERVLGTALLALARTGHPSTAERVRHAWDRGLVDATTAHLAMAEGVLAHLWDEAKAHLRDATAAPAAALHLAVTRHPDLPTLLDPLLTGPDPSLALLAHALLESLRPKARDQLLESVAEAHPARRRRLARGLRAWPEAEVLEAWRAACGLDDDIVLLAVAMDAGIPVLQDEALAYVVERDPDAVREALRRVHTPTAALIGHLPAWMAHPDEGVATAAVRVHSNLLGPDRIDQLEGLAASPRTALRVEWIRVWQNGFMAHRDAAGRVPLPHGDRVRLVSGLRAFMAVDPSPEVRRMAIYCAGNLGLSELGDDVARVLHRSVDALDRRAAAIAIAQMPAARHLGLLADLLARDVDVRLSRRLVLATIRCLDGAEVPPGLADTVADRLVDADPESRPDLLDLLGRAAGPAALDRLREATRSGVHRQACVAISALGRLGLDRALDVLLPASAHPDPERRLRAVEALGRVPGTVATDRLACVLADPCEPRDIRRAALAALGARQQAPTGVRVDPEDPLAGPIFALLRDLADRSLSAADLDRRLARAVPALDPDALERAHPAALQSLRTAEYLHAAVDLPPGLDAAPPVLFWVKGLEVWLNGVLAPRLASLASRELKAALRALDERWGTLKPHLAPRWDDARLPGNRGDLYHALVHDTVSCAPHGFGRAQLGLRALAAVLLACVDPPVACGIACWSSPLERSAVEDLANGLACLANQRNPLTHRRVGRAEDNEPVRELALACAGAIARMS
ncbi:MAG: HEAT repeat domain-containing protein [Deltaproteobacteria bacterium]|nr:HEAT repeat domain-containing protein [Deltaproteobacteria bacterium]